MTTGTIKKIININNNVDIMTKWVKASIRTARTDVKLKKFRSYHNLISKI